ncbi:hypothetical protein [Sulfurospirillum barnesii]|uniref:Uncharacterized protein n=1 Tax=Sulfurospirillum barnesii (strain ATCC 700032 / DSM 10660 / SES-3) TaxID=760154 RepID=I3XUK8_SULBS|nr:hypothetical protein [Sulfurospirillum barnesii]AFL67632.1 hypothetical protein Sulba_0306 [Sulfurospirillum barnesii SES-3]
MSTEIQAVLMLILGWLLGLLSPSIINYIQDKKKAIKIKKSLLSEMEECQIIMANVAYLIESKYVAINHKLFDDLINIYENYNGINDYNDKLVRLKKLKKTPKEELETITEIQLYENMDKFLSFKKYDLPYLRSKINDISLLDENVQSNLLQLNFKLNLFNSEVEESKFHYQLTFSSEVSNENQEINKQILKEKQLIILDQIKQIITLITKLKIDITAC